VAGGAQAQPRAQKIIRVAIGREPDGFVISMTPSATTSGGAFQVQSIPAAKLQAVDDKGRTFGDLAEALPSTTDGTWTIGDDGSMETIWKLRRNVKWHDGTPMTADDLVFGYQAVTSPGVVSLGGAYLRDIREVLATESYTVSVKWSRINVNAATPRDNLPVLPRHILEKELASRSPEAFMNLPYWTTDYVGTGPFKLERWAQGDRLEFAAFDDYFRGRPKLDRLVVRIIPDPNTTIAKVLAGEVDVTLPVQLDVEVALTMKERWEGTRNQVLLGSPGQGRFMYPQSRDESVRPRELLDPRVRRALYQAVDRQSISEAVTRGTAPIADSWVPPSYEIRRDVESAIPQYPFDLSSAQRAFQELGWTRGTDGVLRNSSGQELRLEARSVASARTERESNTAVSGWKQLGIQVDQFVRPAAAVADEEERSKYPGVELAGGSYDELFDLRLSCKNIPSASNGWRGRNSAAWCNQEADTYIDRLQITIPQSERIQLMRGLVSVAMTEIALMPMYWDLDPILAVAGVRGLPQPTAPGRVHTFNVWEWDRE